MKISTYVVKVSYKVLTKKQANELTLALHAAYRGKVEEWTKVKLPKDWGKVTLGGKKIKF